MIRPGPHNKTRCCIYYLDNFFWPVKMVKLVRLLRPGWSGGSGWCQGIGVVSWWYGLIIRIVSYNIWYIADSAQAEYCTTFHLVYVCPSTGPDHSEGKFLTEGALLGYIEEWTGPGQVRSTNRIRKVIPCDISPWQVFDILTIWMICSYWLRECPPRVYSTFTLREGGKKMVFLGLSPK